MFLPSLLCSPRALLSHYKRWLNKVSNLKIHRRFCSHCHWLVDSNVLWIFVVTMLLNTKLLLIITE